MQLEDLQKHFDSRFDEMKEDHRALARKVEDHREEYLREVTTLKVKAGWVSAGISALFAGLISFIISFFKSH